MRKFYQRQLKELRNQGVQLNVKLNQSYDDLANEYYSLTACHYCPLPFTDGLMLGQFYMCCGI